MDAHGLDVAIIGGGIAGLTVGFELSKRDGALNWRLFETSSRLGGKLLSERIAHDDGDFIIEAGPDAFLAAKPWAKELAIELGIEDRLVPINAVPHPAAILKSGRIINLPEGVSLAAPTKFAPFARTPLLSPLGKARAAFDLALPARRASADESVGSFIRRRLGGEMLDSIAEPLMSGIYNADPDELSLQATFPQFAAFERSHRSLIRGLRSARPPQSSGPRPPAFLTPSGGMQELSDALSARIGERCQVGATISAIRKAADGYELLTNDGRRITARALVLAVPAGAAADVLIDVAEPAAARLRRLRAGAAGTIALAVRSLEIARPLAGYGLVIPAREGSPINAITDAGRKFPGRAPAGWTLLRVFFGGARSPESMRLSDDELLAMASDQLRRLLGLRGEPAFHRIHRWPAGSPLYEVGHLERIAEIESILPPNVTLVGSPYRGVGVPDIVRDARAVAATLVERYGARAMATAPARKGEVHHV